MHRGPFIAFYYFIAAHCLHSPINIWEREPLRHAPNAEELTQWKHVLNINTVTRPAPLISTNKRKTACVHFIEWGGRRRVVIDFVRRRHCRKEGGWLVGGPDIVPKPPAISSVERYITFPNLFHINYCRMIMFWLVVVRESVSCPACLSSR